MCTPTTNVAVLLCTRRIPAMKVAVFVALALVGMAAHLAAGQEASVVDVVSASAVAAGERLTFGSRRLTLDHEHCASLRLWCLGMTGSMKIVVNKISHSVVASTRVV